ncbi:hypothetical protein QBC40DRAFT_353192 [Triangularia verruculosa]|uniref:Uncharacterized protein n=1 Tax=Triangularia verruculosa TaxID=2587418 RepID=A0AAN6X5S3_9PEZI|nr:hypothetical protein QBC40DRAFT_353192 [Triangularia verruculosa]
MRPVNIMCTKPSLIILQPSKKPRVLSGRWLQIPQRETANPQGKSAGTEKAREQKKLDADNWVTKPGFRSWWRNKKRINRLVKNRCPHYSRLPRYRRHFGFTRSQHKSSPSVASSSSTASSYPPSIQQPISSSSSCTSPPAPSPTTTIFPGDPYSVPNPPNPNTNPQVVELAFCGSGPDLFITHQIHTHVYGWDSSGPWMYNERGAAYFRPAYPVMSDRKGGCSILQWADYDKLAEGVW